MSSPVPYRLTEPQTLSSAAVFNSPHSGTAYPPELVARSRLGLHALRASEDALVDRIFAPAPDHGAPLLAATAPRAWLDLNRGPDELDPALIEGIRVSGISQRIAAGLGVVPRVVAESVAIYDGKLTLAEVEARIDSIHRPYHARLEDLLLRARDRFGMALLFDCHSMPTEALSAAPRVKGRAPEIVLGDRFGASAARSTVMLAQEAFERAGFTVARNAPFAGGHITQRYGRPFKGMHAIQIEIDRALYMDQKRIEPLPCFDAFCQKIQGVIAELAAIGEHNVTLAAE